MGVAGAVGGIIGSIAGARTGRGGNSALSTIGSMVGSAVASQAASAFVKTVHEDSTQRALERREREAAIKRGEKAPEPPARGSAFRDAGQAFQNMGASMGGAATSGEARSREARANGNVGERPQFPWREALKLAGMAVTACVEMQNEENSRDRRRK